MLFKDFLFFFFLLWMPFCLAEWHHFSILVEGHSRNILVKSFQNPLTGLGGDVCMRAASQLSERGPTDVDVAPVPAR